MYDLKKYIDGFVKLSDEEFAFFESKLERRIFPKRSIILDVGQTENYLSYIEEGSVRFCIPHAAVDGDVTFAFTFVDNFVSAYDSFLLQQPSTYQVITLADTVLLSVGYNDLQHLYAKSAIGERIGRLASEGLFLRKAKRELSLLTESAEQRYLNLFTQEPHLLHFIPLKYIASYIGVTPQALSRIRKRISRPDKGKTK